MIITINYLIQKKDGFREPFIKNTGKIKGSKFKIPKFELEDIEDYYAYYVLCLGISEDLFWNADYSFLLSVVENKCAYDNYINYIKIAELEGR